VGLETISSEINRDRTGESAGSELLRNSHKASRLLNHFDNNEISKIKIVPKLVNPRFPVQPVCTVDHILSVPLMELGETLHDN
jgi:hypothetical protein